MKRERRFNSNQKENDSKIKDRIREDSMADQLM